MSSRWQAYPSAAEAAEACAQHVAELLEDALAGQELASLAVSGGTSPKRMFEILANAALRWDRVHLFWVDERCVPPTDVASNFKMASEHLIQRARIPARNVHRVIGEMAPPGAAKRYAAEIKEFFGLAEGEFPSFDVVHRGMGPDAHTASLFPGDPLIEDRAGIAAATFAAQFKQWRVTLLPGPLAAAKNTVLLVTGEDKKEALRAVFKEEYDPLQYPAQIGVRGARGAMWFLDRAAAESME